MTDADGDTATLTFTIAIEEFSTDIEVPDDLPAELRRVPRSVAVSATGVVTWNLDSNTDADPGTDYLVMWIWDEQPPSRMKLANPFADYATRMERECSGGRCELRIEGFDAGRHYLVHVTTGARFGDRLPAVAVRYTPAPGEALDLTGLPKEVAISGAGLVTWRAASVQVEYYSVAWASGDSRLERSRSSGARGRDYRIVEVDTCADGRCQFQIPNFDAERHWVAEVNSYEREQAAREPVRARYAPGAVDLPAVSVADARVTEADGVTLEFTATLDRAAVADATVDYATADGTARAGEDYTATSGTLTFAAGETSKTIRVPVLDDAYDEGEETLSLTLSNPAGLRIADGEATGTIVNTDPLPLPGSGVSFTVYHDPDHSAAAVSRHDTAVGLLDEAGWPYVVRTVTGTGKVDRLAGVTGTVMPRFFLGDPEDSEWGPAQAKVNNGGLKWLRSVLARLKESSPPAAPTPTLSIAGGSAVAEGTAAAFTVTLSEAAPEGGLTLAYGVSEDGDFVAAADEGAKTVAIPAGATSTPISVPTAADDDDEADGTVTVTLTAGDGLYARQPVERGGDGARRRRRACGCAAAQHSGVHHLPRRGRLGSGGALQHRGDAAGRRRAVVHGTQGDGHQRGGPSRRGERQRHAEVLRGRPGGRRLGSVAAGGQQRRPALAALQAAAGPERVGGRRAGAGGRRRDPGLRGDARPGGGEHGDGGLRDRRRHGDGGDGLHGDERHAHLRGRRDPQDGLGGGARRRARRGVGDADA